MESQLELNEERKALLAKFVEATPEFSAAAGAMNQIAYKAGALSVKVKRLAALAVALKAGCSNCTLGQTEHALKAGATKEEILEIIQVVFSIGGTTGLAESYKVIKFMEESGKW
jgi:AhpD family alkylhydroperoxidase